MNLKCIQLAGSIAVVLATFGACRAIGQTPAATGERGFTTAPAPATPPSGTRYVLAIGIDSYANWPHLGTAVSDATGFADLLHTQFGYQLAAPTLTEANATRQNIMSVIDDELRAKLKPEDDLVIFFAGHGTTRKDQVGNVASRTGFLVPYEAHAPGDGELWSEYINTEDLLRVVSTLKADHVLVILDSCHSGLTLGTGFSRSRGVERERDDLVRKVSRKVIASAEADELASDNGPVRDHSLFTGMLMRGLINGDADNFGQGFVTSSQLGAYVQHAVADRPGSKQTPVFGAFFNDDSGELVLPTAGDFDSLFQRAIAAATVGDQEAFTRFANQAVTLRPKLPQAEWLRYQLDLEAGHYDQALTELKTLDDMHQQHAFSRDLLPMDADNLSPLRFRLHFFINVFALPVTNRRVAIRVEENIPNKGTTTFDAAPGATITLTRNVHYRVIVQNSSPDKLLFGLIAISSTGDVQASRFALEGDNPEDLYVAPGKTATCSLRQNDKAESFDVHVITSPKFVTSLAFPPSGSDRSAAPIPVIDGGEQTVIHLRFE